RERAATRDEQGVPVVRRDLLQALDGLGAEAVGLRVSPARPARLLGNGRHQSPPFLTRAPSRAPAPVPRAAARPRGPRPAASRSARPRARPRAAASTCTRAARAWRAAPGL